MTVTQLLENDGAVLAMLIAAGALLGVALGFVAERADRRRRAKASGIAPGLLLTRRGGAPQ